MSLIGRFEHLPNRPKSDEARPLLEKIASQVKPIMSKRSWKVGTLAEFLPSNPALLGNNMNHGQRINLRLRPPGDPSTFYEYDQLVLVMLHELTHIEHGPHDAKFYKLLAELEEEYYDLKRKGYSGEGFHGQGSHLSGFKVPEHVGKAKGLAAAQKRLDVQKKIGKGGVLGGADHRGRSMKEVIAEAAERRIRDDKSCQTQHEGHAKEVEEEVRKAQQESVGINAEDLEHQAPAEQSVNEDPTGSRAEVEVVVISNDDDSTSLPNTTLSSRQPTSQSSQSRSTHPVDSLPAKKQRPTRLPSDRPHRSPGDNRQIPSPSNDWTCPTCTLINPAQSLACEACTTSRPVRRGGPGEGWYCEFCGNGPREMGYWSCAECGWVRKWG